MTMEELQQIVLQEIINCEGTVEKKAIMKKNVTGSTIVLISSSFDAVEPIAP